MRFSPHGWTMEQLPTRNMRGSTPHASAGSASASPVNQSARPYPRATTPSSGWMARRTFLNDPYPQYRSQGPCDVPEALKTHTNSLICLARAKESGNVPLCVSQSADRLTLCCAHAIGGIVADVTKSHIMRLANGFRPPLCRATLSQHTLTALLNTRQHWVLAFGDRTPRMIGWVRGSAQPSPAELEDRLTDQI